MMESPLNKVNSGSENSVPSLAVLKNNLKLKRGEYEILEYLVSAETEHKELENKHKECANFCRLERKKLERLHKYKQLYRSGPSSSHRSSTKNNPDMVEIKPIFNPDSIPQIIDSLKGFFTHEHQKIFLQILKTGNDASDPLIFLDNGNRLADSFKQLYNCDVITGCEKKELENWIYRNFKYRYREKIVAFTLRYLNQIISTNKDLCQNPILDVKRDRTTGKVMITKI